MPQTHLLIGTNNFPRAEGIYRCLLDLDTGELTRLELSAKIVNPSFMVLGRDNRRLFCVSEAMEEGKHAEGKVYAYDLNPDTCELAKINERSSGGVCPVHLALDGEDKSLYVANYLGGSISSFSIRTDGSLSQRVSFFQLEGSSIHPKRQRQAHAHSIYIDPRKTKAYVCDLGSDKLWLFESDCSVARLRQAKPSFASVKPGSGPRHLAFHQGGKRIFVLNELSSEISVFDFSGLRDQLALKQTISTLPDTFKEKSTCAEIIVSPDGRYVYASNRGHDSIAVFRWNEDASKLEPASRVPTNGQHPRHFAMDATGQYLLVANLHSDNVVSFHIDPENGQLEPTGFSIEVPNPICVRSLPL